jgi:hypothetical protein
VRDLNKDEKDAVLAHLSLRKPLTGLMALMPYNHALRASEVCQMLGTQIVGGRVYVKRLKGSEATDQPLMPNEKDALETRAKEVGSGRMFPFTRKNRKSCPTSSQRPKGST